MELYHFRTDWDFPHAAEHVWAELEDAESWPSWTRGFRRIVLDPPHRLLRPGARASCEVRSALPYTLRFRLEVTEFEPMRTIAVTSDGDVAGTGRWVLDPHDAGTYVTYLWDVGLTRPLLDALGRLPLAKRAMAWNHDHVMADARLGLGSRVAARAAEDLPAGA